MRIRIALIIALASGIACTLGFIHFNGRISTLQLAFEKQGRSLRQAGDELAAMDALLEQSKQELQATLAGKATAEAEAALQTTRAESLGEMLATYRDMVEAEKARAATLEEELTGKLVALRDELDATKAERQVLQRICWWRETRNVIGGTFPRLTSCLPPELTGEVLVYDPKWKFAVLDAGEEEGMLEGAEVLVSRSGRLISKLKISEAQKDRSIGDVVPGWELQDIMEGDEFMPATQFSSAFSWCGVRY